MSLSQIEQGLWVQRFVQNVWIQDGRIQDGWHHQVEWRLNEFESDWDWSLSVFEWMWEKITRYLNQRWQFQNLKMAVFKLAAIIKVKCRMNEFEVRLCPYSLSQSLSGVRVFLSESERKITKVSESKMAVSESNMEEFQDGCHHQVESEWMSLSQIELVWFRVRMEWECFWVNLREDNKVSEFKMAVTDHPKLSENWMMFASHEVELVWVNEVLFCSKWLNPRWQNSGWLPSWELIRLN